MENKKDEAAGRDGSMAGADRAPDTAGGERLHSGSAQQTYAVGKRMGEAARPGEIYTLTGDLGVGKTVFTQGFASGLGITEPVNSPTFTIMQSYEGGRLPLYHFDVYRIGGEEEMDEIGYEEYFYGEGVCLIEWADLIPGLLPSSAIRVTIEKDLEKGFDYRTITISRPAEEERIRGVIQE